MVVWVVRVPIISAAQLSALKGRARGSARARGRGRGRGRVQLDIASGRPHDVFGVMFLIKHEVTLSVPLVLYSENILKGCNLRALSGLYRPRRLRCLYRPRRFRCLYWSDRGAILARCALPPSAPRSALRFK